MNSEQLKIFQWRFSAQILLFIDTVIYSDKIELSWVICDMSSDILYDSLSLKSVQLLNKRSYDNQIGPNSISFSKCKAEVYSSRGITPSKFRTGDIDITKKTIHLLS